MTTIAYHHESKTIAVDTRSVAGSTIVDDDAEKIIVVDGRAFVCCGDFGDIPYFAANFQGHRTQSETHYDCSAIMVEDGVAYLVTMKDHGDHSTYWCMRLVSDAAIGSGEDCAITTMDLGGSASDAVESAIKRDVNTGGKVRTFTLDELSKGVNDDS